MMKYYRLDKICEINPRKTISNDFSDDISFIPMDAVSTDGKIDTSKTIIPKNIKNYTTFREGDVLFAKITPCMENGKGAIAAGLKNGYGAGSTEFIVLRPDIEMVSQKWLQLFLSQRSFRLFCQQNMTGSAGQKRVPPKFLATCELPIPTLEIQEKIIARIEELFSQLDSGVETLKKTKQQLAVYRQAVLREAFDVGNDSEIVEMYELVEDIRIGPFGTALHKSDYLTGGVPVINPQHIKDSHIIPNAKISISPEKADELSAYRLRKNDVIMGRRGEMGRAAAITEVEDGWICGTGGLLFRLKPEYDAEFYAKILSSPNSVHYLEDHATGTTMKNLNEDIVKHIPVPKITKEIQRSITKSLDEKMSICDSIEQTIETVLQQAEAMRQSILKQAFKGGLL